MKIAIPVDNDKKTIFQRTGQAPFFAVYEDDKLVEYVENAHGHLHHEQHQHSHEEHEHHEHTNAHKKDTAGIADCDTILVQMIGENMRDALKSHGIKIQKIRKKDGDTATEALQNFLNNKL